MIHWVSNAEHPLVARHRPDALSNLVGQGLKAQFVVDGSQCTGEGVADAMRLHGRQELVDGFAEPPVEEMLVRSKANQPECRRRQLRRKMVSIDSAEEEQGPDSLVEVVAGSPEPIQFRACREEFLCWPS